MFLKKTDKQRSWQVFACTKRFSLELMKQTMVLQGPKNPTKKGTATYICKAKINPTHPEVDPLSAEG